MSNTVWCDLNSRGDLLKLHVKMISFTPNQTQMEAAALKSKFHNILGVPNQLGMSFRIPHSMQSIPYIGMAVGAKTKNPQVTQATKNF